jgi:Flp pilus assembly protein TadG
MGGRANLLRRRNARFNWRTDERGGVAIYVALISVVLFGIIGLALDASRAMIISSEAQAAADAAALAAASQLDGTPTAITRANAALANLVENQQRFASTGASAVTIAGVRYLSELPASDTLPITDDFVTTNPLQARFVEVTTGPLTHLNTFLRAVGATAPLNIARQAVAGCNQIVCRVPPMMICNPAEAAGGAGAQFDISAWRGRQVILMHQGGMNSSWAPGNFGYLQVSAPGANALRDALASVNGANDCYGADVTTEPGAKTGARAALNVRFGIYQNPGFGGGAGNDALFAPDINVRTMPRDLPPYSGPNGRFGSGHWDCLTYWNTNFSSSSVMRPTGCVSDTSNFTRYQMYQFEIDNGLDLQAPQNAANELADRRIIYVAVVNCVDEGLSGRRTVTSVNFLKIFLTEPVNEPTGVEIVGEIVDVVQVGADDGVLYDNVQLYR